MRLSKAVFAIMLIAGALHQGQHQCWAQPATGIKVRGFVRNNAGRAVQGDVTLVQGTSRRIVRNIQTTPEGYYEAVLPFAGSALLVAKAPGLSSQTLNVTGNRNETLDFTLRKPIRVAGRVTAPGGVPIPNALVRVRYPDTVELFQFRQEVGDVTTDEQGRFALEFVRPFSRFVLEVEAVGYQLRHSSDLFSRDSDMPLTAAVQMQRGVSVRGQVVDDNGAPVANAFVTLRHRGSGSRGSSVTAAVTNTTTSSNGEFVFSGLALGDYAIVVRKPGFKPQQRLVDLVSTDDDRPHRLALTR